MGRQHFDRPTAPAGSIAQPFPASAPSSSVLESNDVVTFGVPGGYRLVPRGMPLTVECARGCGWTLAVSTLSAMPADLRDHLFQYHEAWHTKRARPSSAVAEHAITPLN